jgi:hypothetical protein
LLVDVRFEGDADIRHRVASVLLYLLRWVDYIDARWVTTGVCGRRFIASLLAGLDRIHALASEDDAIWKYHLNGFSKATPAVRRYLTIAAMAAYPCESLLAEFLEDDRLLRRVEYFKNVLNEEFKFLLSLPMCIWDRLADVADKTWGGAALKADVIRASLYSMGFLHLDFFHLVDVLPYSLTQGDLQANLERLRAAPEDLDFDPLTKKIKFLLTTRCPPYELIQGLVLLRELPCSIRIVEQNHAAGSWLMKLHPLIEEDVLRDRCVVNQFRALVRKSSYESKVGKLETALQDLDSWTGQLHG